MFDYKNANSAQREAISATNGPVLITAGPGTGKTFTLVQRAIYLIQECSVPPEQILIATFTEKAAKELITRITNELAARDITANVDEMYVGTFHSLCLRMIEDHLEYTRLKKNYRLLDAFDQMYLVFRNINRFRDIDGLDEILSDGGAWKQAGEICNYVNTLSEELVEADDLLSDCDPYIVALGDMLQTYQELLCKSNLMDFSAIQTECFRLLTENQEILEGFQNQLKYLMIDEYQDTNYIQERLVFLLGEKHQNICVVGDDDQGLYRFRGATVRNILEFPQKFEEGVCKIIHLTVNYRSNSDIVDFYNQWMAAPEGGGLGFSWQGFRYAKQIEPNGKTRIPSPAVAKLSSRNSEDHWKQQILDFINRLKESGKLKDYNQLAFLFHSVKNPAVTGLAEFLEKNGIHVYSPRSNMFFKRGEIKLLIGCLMRLFPRYVDRLEKEAFEFLGGRHYAYYKNCVAFAGRFLQRDENHALRQFIENCGKIHAGLQNTTDYAYSGLLYQLFAFQPFRKMLDIDMDAGVVDMRPTRNLALFTQIIGKYEYLHQVNVLNGQYIDRDTERLFNLYLKLLYDGGITEYEDDSEYAPSGCVSFLTIHQSKGMEFPIVFVDSLGNSPWKPVNHLMIRVEQKYFHREAFEPYDKMKFFDFWRLYYTAFSRAQDLLVLTCNEDWRTPSKSFSGVYSGLKSVNGPGFRLEDFDFHTVKNVNLKEIFSFTSHISVFETCALQYKFYKELGFMPVREGAFLFGTLVHETIEDIHRAAMRKEEHLITAENIADWFERNYQSLIQAEHAYLAEPQKRAALKQALRYAERQAGKWDMIQQAEVDVSLVQPDYIIKGKIDLIKGSGGTVEIVDFKSEKKPDMEKAREQLERYRRQLQIYAYLVEQRTGQKVSRMHLYYTAEEGGNPMVSFPCTKTAVEGTVAAFDDTVHQILRKDFGRRAADLKTCQNCDFRFYCKD